MQLPERNEAALPKMQGLHWNIGQEKKLLQVKIFYLHQNKKRN
jgi:hypothetical protein